jgi:hypothetical protein
VRVRDQDAIKDIHVPDGEVYTFIFPPGQSHAIKNLSSATNILVAFNTVEHDRQHPDTEADVLIMIGTGGHERFLASRPLLYS